MTFSNFAGPGHDQYICGPECRVDHPATELPVGAVLASALMAANYPGDSGEDVDRLIAELAQRGYEVRAVAPLAAERREL